MALQTEEEQINDKLFNMIKNKCLPEIRREDSNYEKPRRIENPWKRVTWSKNLHEVHQVTSRQCQVSRSTSDPWPEENCLRPGTDVCWEEAWSNQFWKPSWSGQKLAEGSEEFSHVKFGHCKVSGNFTLQEKEVSLTKNQTKIGI